MGFLDTSKAHGLSEVPEIEEKHNEVSKKFVEFSNIFCSDTGHFGDRLTEFKDKYFSNWARLKCKDRFQTIQKQGHVFNLSLFMFK